MDAIAIAVALDSEYVIQHRAGGNNAAREHVAEFIRCEIRRQLSRKARDERHSAICAPDWWTEMKHRRRADLLDELQR